MNNRIKAGFLFGLFLTLVFILKAIINGAFASPYVIFKTIAAALIAGLVAGTITYFLITEKDIKKFLRKKNL